MIVIGAMLGPTAVFLNEFSVLQRTVKRSATSIASLVAQKSDAVREQLFVAQTIIGGGPIVGPDFVPSNDRFSH